MTRPVYQIARDIKKAWGPKVYFGAKPYLDALLSLDGPSDAYACDSGKSVALYFLGNASTFRGPEAKALKAELKAVYGIK